MWVEWKESALDELADIYVAADPADRDEIERTVEQINAALAANPQFLGESRATPNQRAWLSDPLTVTFQIIPADGTVIVHHVAHRRP
ncbi:MAG TPA: type II toxin-antitoxin system RelE/ParE family toxin [Fimbriiglobus sp.]|jgi:hypothetical protein|nr:type II toxin-antitoxin system RelE/ParE family toxin [Fimbriiglobus sp.]